MREAASLDWGVTVPEPNAERPVAPTLDLPAGRVHGLSDGVYAIVMTLLVLELHVPELADGLSRAAENAEVFRHLTELSGKLTIYAMTFLVTGLSWISHSRLFLYVPRTDNHLGFLNVVYLMMVSLLPFTSALIGSFGSTATGVASYALNQILISAAFLLMLHHVGRNRLAVPGAPLRQLGQRSYLSLGVFAVMFALAFLYAPGAWFSPFVIPLAQPLITRRATAPKAA